MSSRLVVIKNTVKEKYKAATGIGVAAFVVAVLMVVVVLVPVVWALTDIDSPAFYRMTLLVFNSMFAMSIGSVFADMQMFDFWTALVLGVFAIAANVALVIAESIRWANCGSSPIAVDICNNYAGEIAIVPVIALIEMGLSLVAFILLFIWRSRKAAWQESYTQYVSSTTRRSTVTRVETTTEVEEGDEPEPTEGAGVETTTMVVPLNPEQTSERRIEMIAENRKSGTQVALAIFGVVAFVTIFAVGGAAIALLFFEDQVSFYRGYFIIVPAHYAAAEFSFLGHVPRGWRTVYMIFAFLALVSAGVGSYFEVMRMVDCINGVPVGQVDTDICNNEFWSRYIMPIALLFIGVLALISFILHIFLAFEKSYTKKITTKINDD